MNSVCISSCVRDARPPLRATYMNLYKWPESDAEFMMRSLSFSGDRSLSLSGGGRPADSHPAPSRVVDSISCRQMYLRSYPFSREEDAKDRRSIMCFGGGRDQGKRPKERHRRSSRRRKRSAAGPCPVLRKARDMSLGALFKIFQRLLSCSASVDVAD